MLDEVDYNQEKGNIIVIGKLIIKDRKSLLLICNLLVSYIGI
jgi:hypothetical protein